MEALRGFQNDMATGYLYNSICYVSLAQATAARWSDVKPGITAGSTSYLTDVQFSGTVWQIKRYTLSSTGTLTLNTTTTAPTLAFPSCDTAQNFNDGMLLGWGVAAAMVAAFSVKFLSRALHR